MLWVLAVGGGIVALANLVMRAERNQGVAAAAAEAIAFDMAAAQVQEKTERNESQRLAWEDMLPDQPLLFTVPSGRTVAFEFTAVVVESHATGVVVEDLEGTRVFLGYTDFSWRPATSAEKDWYINTPPPESTGP